MSLKRRAKIQHCSSPKSQIHKQINNDLSMTFSQKYQDHQQRNSPEYILLRKMQQKILKILSAYQKLQDQSKKKDDTIMQLQRQNELLKERLVSRNHDRQYTKTAKHEIEARKQPKQGHIIQRTFTPVDVKPQFQQQKQITHKRTESYRPIQSYKPIQSIVQGYTHKDRDPVNKLLKESRSVQNLNRTISYRSTFQIDMSNFTSIPIQFNQQTGKVFTKRDQNRVNFEGLEQDKTFLDVLGKLKDKIKKFDDDDAENYNTIPQMNHADNNPFKLSKVKSTHNMTRRPYNLAQQRPKQNADNQIKALKKIWNERDQQIKRMDQLFKDIDERLNITQK